MATLSLKGRALKYLAAREHSRAELVRKLAPHAENADTLDALLDELEAKGLLSSQRFIESVVHRKANRFGVARIRQELASHGLPETASADALRRLQASELDRARAVWQKKFGAPAPDAPVRARHMRFLAARGFGGEVIRQVLREADRGDLGKPDGWAEGGDPDDQNDPAADPHHEADE